MRSDPNLPGTEKLAVAAIQPELVASGVSRLTVSDIVGGEGPPLMDPMSVFLVKGWSRSLCAIGCLLHAFEIPDVLEAWGCVMSRICGLSHLEFCEMLKLNDRGGPRMCEGDLSLSCAPSCNLSTCFIVCVDGKRFFIWPQGLFARSMQLVS